MEKGKLSLKDSVQRFIPDYPSKGYPITIENLLTHTLGIPDYMRMGYKDAFMERKDFAPKEVVDLFKNAPLEFEPGTQFKYSNSGYYLLGYIIEAITGESYEKYIRENILDPLSLTHTFITGQTRLFPVMYTGIKKKRKITKNQTSGAPPLPILQAGWYLMQVIC